MNVNQEQTNNDKPHWVEPEYGAGYWRKFRFCSDERVVIGAGITPEAAEENALSEANKIETYLSLPDIERLRILAKGDLLDSDQREAIRLIVKILDK